MVGKKCAMPKLSTNLSYAATMQRKAINLGKTNTLMSGLASQSKVKMGKQAAANKAAKFNKTVDTMLGRKTPTKQGKK